MKKLILTFLCVQSVFASVGILSDGYISASAVTGGKQVSMEMERTPLVGKIIKGSVEQSQDQALSFIEQYCEDHSMQILADTVEVIESGCQKYICFALVKAKCE